MARKAMTAETRAKLSAASSARWARERAAKAQEAELAANGMTKTVDPGGVQRWEPPSAPAEPTLAAVEAQLNAALESIRLIREAAHRHGFS